MHAGQRLPAKHATEERQKPLQFSRIPQSLLNLENHHASFISTPCLDTYLSSSRALPVRVQAGTHHAKPESTMTSRLSKLVAGAVALLALIPSVCAQPSNGAVIAPDAGASIVLLAIGCSGVAVAARKRFFKR